jgi:hypothetical protein
VSELICPYCWNDTKAKQLLSRCPEQCPQRTFIPASAKVCPHGKQPSKARYCPRCEKMLEHDYITTKSHIIAMIGSRAAGKSTYVGVLVRELKNRVGPAFNGMSTELVGDKSRTRYREVFAGPLFDKGEVVTFTNPVRTQYRLDPLLFMLRFPRRKYLWDQLTAAMMIFYDTSGEDVLKDENIENLVDYLDAASGIVLLIDPLQISSVRRGINDDVPLPPNSYDQVAIVQRLAELLRQRRGMSGDKRIDTPLAVAVAKTDAIGAALPANSVVRRPGSHNGVYDDADGQYVHDELRATLSGWDDGEDLLNIIANNFSSYRFFGISALGATPPNHSQVAASGIHPLRVEDPLLWLLGQFGLVPVRKARR